MARRGQGFSEHLHGLKTPLFKALEAGEGGEGVPNRRAHSLSLCRLTRDLGLHNGAGYPHPLPRNLEPDGKLTPGTAASLIFGVKHNTLRTRAGNLAPSRKGLNHLFQGTPGIEHVPAPALKREYLTRKVRRVA